MKQQPTEASARARTLPAWARLSPVAAISNADSRPARLGELWQLPTFLLGLTVFLAAYLLVPRAAQTPVEAVDQAIRNAQHALEAGRAAEALRWSREGWRHIHAVPGQASCLRFLMGSAYLAGGGAGEEGLDAASIVSRARTDLEAADPKELPESWRPLRIHRLAVACSRAEAPAEVLIPLWEEAARTHPPARLEAYNQLLELYLAIKPPRIDAAVDVSEKLLLLPDLKEANLVRLRRAELLLAAGKPEEARQVLRRVAADSPAAERANQLLAHTWQAEREWTTAAAMWSEALKKRDDPVTRYFLGYCHLQLEQFDAAYDAWRPLLAPESTGKEARAAQFRWATSKGRQGPGPAARSLLVQVLQSMGGAGFHSAYLSAEEARTLLSALLEQWQAKGEAEAVLEILPLATPLLPASDVYARMGEAREHLGRMLLAEAERHGQPAADSCRKRARENFSGAAEAFQKLAELNERSPRDVTWSWRAAENRLRAGQYAQALLLFEAELRRPLPAERRALALIAAGEAYAGLGQHEQAASRFQDASRLGGPQQARALYLLAVSFIQRQQYREAELALREVANTPRIDSEPAEVVNSRFVLGYVLFWQQRYSEAAKALEAAVTQHPADAQALLARYWWAEAHRQTAGLQARQAEEAQTPAARDYYRRQRQQELEAALALFQQVDADLLRRKDAGVPADAEKQLLQDTRACVGQCLLELGRTAEAVTLFEAAVLDTGGTAAELYALKGLTQALVQSGRKEEARAALTRLRTLLGEMPDEAFAPPKQTRNQWFEWLGSADRAAQ